MPTIRKYLVTLELTVDLDKDERPDKWNWWILVNAGYKNEADFVTIDSVEVEESPPLDSGP